MDHAGRGAGRWYPTRVRLGAALATVLLVVAPAAASGQTAELDEDLEDLGDEVERTEDELADARAEERAARAELLVVEERLAEARERADELAVRAETARAEHEAATAAADEARAHATAVHDELAATEGYLAEKSDQLDARVRAAFKYGQVSYLQVFTGVADIAEFLNSGSYLAHVLEGDRQLVVTVADLLDAVEERRAEAAAARRQADRTAEAAGETREEVEAAHAGQLAAARAVEEQHAEREAIFAELRENRAALEGHLDGLEAESQRIEEELAEIARQQAEEAARRAAEEAARRAAEEAARRAAGEAEAAPSDQEAQPGAGTGPWQRPSAGRLTSPFGPRWGRSHNGVDLAGGFGAPVTAARDGIVVTAVPGCHPSSSWGCGGGFGNYVTVAHADGMATIYAHLSGVAVGRGAAVSAGQQLGAIGNSGNSYGSHLHFEVRERGVPRNPCGYIGC